MAKETILDATVILNGVTLSNRVKSVSFPVQNDWQESTAMGQTAKDREPGVQDYSVDIDFYGDEDVGSVGPTLRALLLTPAKVTIEIRRKSTARSATNPGYVGTVGMTEWNPLGSGQHGQVHMAPAKFVCAGAALQVLTS